MFAQILKSLADGNMDDALNQAIKRKKNGAPIITLTPGQEAVQDLDRAVSDGISQRIAVDEGIADAPYAEVPQGRGKFDVPYDIEPVKQVPMAQSFTTPATTTSSNIGAETMTPRSMEQLPDAPVYRGLSEVEKAQRGYDEARNAPIKKQSFWKDFGAKLIQGADTFFNGNRDPIVGWGRLKHDARVAEQRQNLMAARETEKAQQESAARNLDYRLKTLKGVQDSFNNDPDVMIIKESNRVTPDQAKRLNAKYGTSYTPQYWGTYIEKTGNGVPYIRPSDNPNYVQNTSLPTDPTQAVVNANIGGQTVPTTNEKLLPLLENREKVNASQAFDIEKFNKTELSEVQKRNIDRLNKYNADVVDTANKMATALAGIGDDAGATEIGQLIQQIEQASLAHKETGDEKALEQFNKLQLQLTQLLDKQRNNNAKKSALSGFKMPTKPKMEKAVQMQGKKNDSLGIR